MGPVVAKKSGHGLGPTRARVLRYLLAQHELSSVTEIAESLTLHPNTIRFHLEALIELGYIAEEREKPQGQGRPRRLYRVTPEAPEVDTSHLRDLTQVLLRHIVGDAEHPKQVVEGIGQAWGKEVAEAADQDLKHLEQATAADALEEIISHTQSMGFEATRTADDTVAFTSCPYRSINQPMLANICAIHFGLLRGYLDEAQAPMELRELTPGTTCIARFAKRNEQK